jgi:hypothetical protein
MVFGLIPYLLLFSAIPAKKVWLEIGLFAGRIVATFLLSLFGWVVTMNALAISGQRKGHELSEKL